MDYNKLLLDLKKSNKERKLKLAIKYGYSTVEEYLNFLLNKMKENILEEIIVPTIHKCVIIDTSSSMLGSKLKNALKGINQEIIELQKQTNINYLYTLIEFSTTVRLNPTKPISEVSEVYFSANGYTALYDSIGKAFELFSEVKEKVLVNVFTDGEENMSKYYNKDKINRLIEENPHITLTFVGTESDVLNIQKDLKIDSSNTMSYDGTGAGLYRTMEATLTSTVYYSNRVAKGLDVSRGFYKNIKK